MMQRRGFDCEFGSNASRSYRTILAFSCLFRGLCSQVWACADGDCRWRQNVGACPEAGTDWRLEYDARQSSVEWCFEQPELRIAGSELERFSTFARPVHGSNGISGYSPAVWVVDASSVAASIYGWVSSWSTSVSAGSAGWCLERLRRNRLGSGFWIWNGSWGGLWFKLDSGHQPSVGTRVAAESDSTVWVGGRDPIDIGSLAFE